MSDLTALVKEHARGMGADLVGIAPVARWKHAPGMLSPQAHLPEARAVVVMGIHHPDASVEWGGLPNSNYAGPFQIGMIPKLDTMSHRMARFLERHGHKSIPMPCTGYWRHRPYKGIRSTNTSSFSHRHAAVAAGLGVFGWNNLLLSERFGPRQRLISVITSAELTPDPLYRGPELCDRCNMCAKRCPGDNFSGRLVLESGFDEVLIEDQHYKYAKLNRWRCLWGEQFAMDMDRLSEFDVSTEEDLYRAAGRGVRRVGGEFGNCFRYCMSQPIRYWDRQHTTAPRRQKQHNTIPTRQLVDRIRRLARINGADRLAIQPLADFADRDMQQTDGYPVERMREHFSWVISFACRVPSYPTGHALLDDDRAFLEAAVKVRLSVAAYDIAAYLDELGHEAMQDWMSLSSAALRDFDRTPPHPTSPGRRGVSEDPPGEAGCYEFSEGEQRPFSRGVRYKVAARDEMGVQREQQSMTAGAADKTDSGDRAEHCTSCAVICQAPLDRLQETIHPEQPDLPLDEFERLACIEQIDAIGVVSVDNLEGIPGLLDFKKALPGARSVVVLLMAIPERVVELAGRQEAECAVSYSYLQYQILREVLGASGDLAAWLECKGHRTLPLADCSLGSFRTVAPYWEFAWAKLGHPDLRANAPVAAAAGLGQVGRSGLLLTPQFGPRHEFVCVVTTADLPQTGPFDESVCLECGKCAAACPVGALQEDQVATLEIRGRTCEIYSRHEDRCQWSRSLGMVAEAGPCCIGWKTPDMPIPGEINQQTAQEALNKKDPLQVVGYLYPCQVDTIVQRCLQACPVGT